MKIIFNLLFIALIVANAFPLVMETHYPILSAIRLILIGIMIYFLNTNRVGKK